ncbi:MAG: hypothetical protein JWP32_2450, partial [Schumannella sp.]|nr:hypothetical protein [Schumannella sp.]
KFVAMAMSPLLQVFQGWVPAASGLERVHRMRVAGRVVSATAVVGGVLYTVFLPSFSQLLTHGQVGFTVAAAVAFGLNMTLTIVSPYLTNIGLMTFGRLRAIAVSVAVGVVVTLIALVLVEAFAPGWAVWALVGGNVFVSLWQYLVLRGALRSEAGLTPDLTPNNPEAITTPDRSPAPAIPYV